MKKKLMIIACMCLSVGVWGQETFYKIDVNGNKINYRETADGRGVVVTHAERQWPYYGEEKPKGRVVVPKSVEYRGEERIVMGVDDCAFYGCEDIESVEIGEGVKKIGAQAFCGCRGLRRVEIKGDVEEVADGAFAYCKSLIYLILPPTVRRIGTSAFSMCESLGRVEMDEHVRELCDEFTFYGCRYRP